MIRVTTVLKVLNKEAEKKEEAFHEIFSEWQEDMDRADNMGTRFDDPAPVPPEFTDEDYDIIEENCLLDEKIIDTIIDNSEGKGSTVFINDKTISLKETVKELEKHFDIKN